MRRYLFINVGTGVSHGEEDAIDSLGHGILASIKDHRPDFIVFFGSEKSKAVLDSIKKQYKISFGENLSNYEFVQLENVDDFDSCYECIENKLKTAMDSEIIIDYTTGTKTMAISAAICALLYRKSLSVVSGKRGPKNIVMEGTECVRSVNLFQAYNRIQFDRAFMAFNSYRFEEAKSHLRSIAGDYDIDKYVQIFNAYDLWDKFDHLNSFNILKNIKCDKLNNNKGFLGRLSSNNIPELLLAELLNNAERRIEEGKYDDAVARLYRSIEYISQIKLSRYSIKTDNIDVDLLKKLGLDTATLAKFNGLKNEKQIIKVGLNLGYEILQNLDDELGKRFLEDKELKNILSKRNSSILAHGTRSICKADAISLLEKGIAYSRIIFKDIDNSRDQGKFPKLHRKGMI
ncbi:CRISPR-associated protein (Cas_Cas02710) [uncultured archaeon]|nr:CRISPR-associated protein (Cas_Cas02710) [uncultured archaeon]